MIDRDDHGNPVLPNRTGGLPPREERDFVTSIELITESGISYRQADYWTRTGLLVPLTDALPGSGSYRVFADTQVRRARVLHQLLDAGWSLQMCRAHIDELLEHGSVTVGALTITVHNQHGGDAA